MNLLQLVSYLSYIKSKDINIVAINGEFTCFMGFWGNFSKPHAHINFASTFNTPASAPHPLAVLALAIISESDF